MTAAGFPAAARAALQRHPAAPQPRQGDDDDPRQARRGSVAEVDDWEALRAAGAAIKDRALATLPEQLERLEASVTRAGGTVHWARDGAEANAIVAGHRARPRQRRGHQGQVAGHGRDRAQRGARGARHPRDGDRSRGADRPARRRRRRRTSSCPPSTRTGRRSPRCSSARSPRASSSGSRRRRSPRRRAGTCATKFLTVPVAVSGANFGVAETGTICVVESEGNGRMCTTLPRVLITVMGIEKVLRRVARPRGDAPAPAALLHRRADEPVHVAVDRRARRRRPARVPPRAARRRAHRRAGRRGRAPGAALHPLLRLPERLPGLLAHGRARVRVRLSRADRGDPHAAAGRARPRADAAVGVEPVRRLLRGLPGARSTSRRCSCTCAAGWCGRSRGAGARSGSRWGRSAACSAAARGYERAQRLARVGARAAGGAGRPAGGLDGDARPARRARSSRSASGGRARRGGRRGLPAATAPERRRPSAATGPEAG